MGMTDKPEELVEMVHATPAYPSIPKKAPSTPFEALVCMLPLDKITPAPVAVAAKIKMQTIDFEQDNIASIIMIGDALNTWFEEIFWNSVHHRTGGLILHYDKLRGHCRIIDMCKGTWAAKLPRWRSRIYNAFVLSIIKISVHQRGRCKCFCAGTSAIDHNASCT